MPADFVGANGIQIKTDISDGSPRRESVENIKLNLGSAETAKIILKKILKEMEIVGKFPNNSGNLSKMRKIDVKKSDTAKGTIEYNSLSSEDKFESTKNFLSMESDKMKGGKIDSMKMMLDPIDFGALKLENFNSNRLESNQELRKNSNRMSHNTMITYNVHRLEVNLKYDTLNKQDSHLLYPSEVDITPDDGNVVTYKAKRFVSDERVRGKYDVSPDHPIHILFPLPTEGGRPEVNPFGITIDLARPVVDEAVDEVYRRQLVPLNSLEIHFEDSKLSDAHGPNVAINQLVNNRLDCIIGYAFVYALAPVARMSPYWRDKDSNGIPVITSVGLTSNLDNRVEYQLMTRISSPYKVVKNAVLALFEKMNWRKCAYIFHDQRYDNTAMSVPYGECYLLMASLQPYLHRINKLEHNYFMFNEVRYSKERMHENLKKASTMTNASRWFAQEKNHWMVGANAVPRCALCDGRARKMSEKCGVGLLMKSASINFHFKNFHVAE